MAVLPPSTHLWYPNAVTLQSVLELMQEYRGVVAGHLDPLIRAYAPDLEHSGDNAHRKMLELSTKMTLVGRACTEIAGYEFDERRKMISVLFGGCCFLADSFIDDYGPEQTREYLNRLELLLTNGWFEIRNDREQLFYVILSRLFYERDILEPMLRQAIMALFQAQKRDVEMRETARDPESSRHRQLRTLASCARDRSGHAISVLTGFLVPSLSLHLRRLIFAAGALIMHIDDHGDCYADRRGNRITYMNQVRNPGRALQRIFERTVGQIHRELPLGPGRDLMIGFLFRYYVTRIRKHKLERTRSGSGWAVYE